MKLAHRLFSSDLENSTSPYEDHIKGKVTQEGEKLLGPLHWWPPKSNLQEPSVPRKHERLLALDLLPHNHSLSFRHLNKPATDIRLGLNLDAKRFVRKPPFTWSILIQHLLECRVWAFHGLKGPPKAWLRLWATRGNCDVEAIDMVLSRKKPLATMKRFLLLQALTHFLTLKGLQWALKTLRGLERFSCI